MLSGGERPGSIVISAVAVVIPARDEAERIGACLDSVAVALERVRTAGPAGVAPTGPEVAVHVVVSASRDDTAAVVDRSARGRPGWSWAGAPGRLDVGQIRAAGCASALARLAAHPPRQVWLLNTDADTVVAPGWAACHLALARRGAAAVAGLADLDGTAHLHPVALERYQALVAAQSGPASHSRVYGANLGVRADAYLGVGGFRPLARSEDADLVGRLRAAGHLVACPLEPPELTVRTSARTTGRASGGLADLLRRLDEDDRPA